METRQRQARSEEVRAFLAEVERKAVAAGRHPASLTITARLNACVGTDGRAARDVVRPTVARLLGRGSLKLATAARQGLTFPPEATAAMADRPMRTA